MPLFRIFAHCRLPWFSPHNARLCTATFVPHPACRVAGERESFKHVHVYFGLSRILVYTLLLTVAFCCSAFDEWYPAAGDAVTDEYVHFLHWWQHCHDVSTPARTTRRQGMCALTCDVPTQRFVIDTAESVGVHHIGLHVLFQLLKRAREGLVQPRFA